MFMSLDRELVPTLILSGCFMLLFAADASMVNMQKIIVSSISHEIPGFSIEGYTVNGLVYTFFAISLWFGPFLSYAIGPRITMFMSAFGYLFYSASYLVEEEWAIYAGATITGLAAGTLWPAQGHYLIGHSTPENSARNFAIFWFIFMSSEMVGNVFVYFKFHGKMYIDRTTRRTTIYGLLVINVLSLFAFLTLPKSTNENPAKEYGPIKTVKKSFSIIASPRMMLLIITYCYVGVQQAFWGGVYSASIGFTTAFGDSAKELVALSGICLSFGALVGAFGPILFAEWIRKHRYSRKLIVATGILAQLLCFLITFINLPDSAVFGDTDKISLIQPNKFLALLGSLLLCFGDSCLSTQVYSLIGDYYRESSAEACALYKFFKGVFIAVSFYSCSHLGLHTQVSIMAVMAVVGLVTFCVADRDGVLQATEKKV